MVHDRRGHVGVAMLHPSHPENVGGVVRAAGCFDADYVVTIGHQYSHRATAVGHEKHVPIWHFRTFKDLLVALPYETDVVAVDYNPTATRLSNYQHPERALYVLGEEGPGFGNHPEVVDWADSAVYMASEYCMNVAVAGNMVLRDRYVSDGVPDAPVTRPHDQSNGFAKVADVGGEPD